MCVTSECVVMLHWTFSKSVVQEWVVATTAIVAGEKHAGVVSRSKTADPEVKSL